ncbi:FHA domain-containing protein, partial [Angustibacter speluncae]
ELALVGGLHAGPRVPLPEGAPVRVGRAQACTLRTDDPETSREHLALTRRVEPVEVRVRRGCDGTRVGSARADGAVVGAGDPVGLGETVLAARPAAPAADVLAPVPGGVLLNRPPRIVPDPVERSVRLPDLPRAPQRRRIPWLLALAPLVLAGVLYLVVPSFGPFLLFMAMSPLLVVGTALVDRRHGRQDHAEDLARAEAERARGRERYDALVARERDALRSASPDPASVLRAASGPSPRLWERRAA